MVRFYRATINKVPVGSAVEHREPHVQGEVITKVTDSTTAGDYKLFVVDADDAQHEANLTLPGVQALSEKEATKLAAQYQPKRTLTQFNPLTRKEEKVDIPAVDLQKFIRASE